MKKEGIKAARLLEVQNFFTAAADVAVLVPGEIVRRGKKPYGEAVGDSIDKWERAHVATTGREMEASLFRRSQDMPPGAGIKTREYSCWLPRLLSDGSFCSSTGIHCSYMNIGGYTEDLLTPKTFSPCHQTS